MPLARAAGGIFRNETLVDALVDTAYTIGPASKADVKALRAEVDALKQTATARRFARLDQQVHKALQVPQVRQASTAPTAQRVLPERKAHRARLVQWARLVHSYKVQQVLPERKAHRVQQGLRRL
ncbi:hypothetical protein COCSUDRAFT_55838 [Coccomyxa subellipsoidea C-169]|uniref:Uncharacterized protein n=1 Tax=Coccomyxa subellipsoidea (strain C-169) TaxID=574566 RepID=I0YUS2_COCSC|nr:hypothetical protein COCSUDRAFT_55838 [Coccomyxa subellipsoidea C-169]EIE22141.1 hypothetical protein COCSUDRAFT_55838 [Coccomyxa subellipsoidea C-169]|eukprot:XP_005646685.1 hypothetical protein COCSUDRAFT_55838 [Coccomyxa subellipsoidea C-169]